MIKIKKYNYFKYRMYPNDEQKAIINKTFGCARFIFNYYLAKRIELFKKENKTMNYYACSADLTQLKNELIWLKDVDSRALQNSLKNLDQAYQNFFNKQKKFPKFKSKHTNQQSYRTNNDGKKIEIKDNKIKIPKLSWVKFAKSREIDGKIINATISRNPSGKYFVSVCFETEHYKPEIPTNNTIGLDMGLTFYIIDSNGNKIENPKHYRKYEQKLKKLQRSLSRKKKGSKNRNKARIKVARIHEKIANTRTDFLHKLSTKLIHENQVIALESLKVKNMIKNKNLSKSIADASWGEFSTMLKYKADLYGRELKFVDTFFPSSKLCSCCGHKVQDMPLRIREWTCDNCNTFHDRDVNAAINILNNAV